jgi:tetratricopeptide (TPR) repeat protein
MSQTEQEFHRKIAAECFNRAWDYLEKKNRGPADDEMMLNLAHASRYHWSLIGKPLNFTTGDWQISRVYAALNQPDLALSFAKRALEICQKNDLSERLVSAYEGMARAYTVAKEYSVAREFISKARQQLSAMSLDDEDRKIYLDQIDETELMAKK